MAQLLLREESVEVLRDLIRADTVNPPGNETEAAELLRGYLEASGVECELYAKIPERANLVARLPGRGDGPTLLLLWIPGPASSAKIRCGDGARST
jgi:acetylornithine deacetylase/succinyl-diaminopimelate desuccinylase-like protein